MLILVLGLAVFLGVHLVPVVNGLKAGLVGRLGEGPYKVLFSVVAAVGLVLVVWGYAVAREAGSVVLYDPPTWLRHVTMLLMIPVFPLVVAAYLPGRIAAAVRHPMITAVKVWAFAHLLANGDAASVLLFAGFLAWGVLARISMKRREAAGLSRVRTAGPVLNDVIAVVVGLAIYGAFVWRLHLLIIGVPVM